MTYVVVGGLVCALIFGGTTIAAGVFTGVLLFIAMAVLYVQMPKPIKKFVIFFRFVIDFGVSGLVLGMLGTGTATALVGSVSCGLLVTLGLHSQTYILKDKSMLFEDAQRIIEATRRL